MAVEPNDYLVIDYLVINSAIRRLGEEYQVTQDGCRAK